MALFRDRLQAAGGFDSFPGDALTYQAGSVTFNIASLAMTGMTSVIASTYQLGFDAAAGDATNVRNALAKTIQELIRKGVLAGTWTT